MFEKIKKQGERALLSYFSTLAFLLMFMDQDFSAHFKAGNFDGMINDVRYQAWASIGFTVVGMGLGFLYDQMKKDGLYTKDGKKQQ